MVLLLLKNQRSILKAFSCLLFCITYFHVSAQQNQKSKKISSKPSAIVRQIQVLEKRSLDLSASYIDSAMQLARLAVKLSGEYKNDTCFTFSYLALGWCFYYEGNRDSAEHYILKAANNARNLKMYLLEGKCLVNLSYVYQEGSEYIKLLNCLSRARPLVENDELTLSAIDLTMGSTYGDMQLYEQGKKYIFSSLAITKKLNRTDLLSSCYSALGYLLLQENNYDSALYYYRIGYAVSIELDDLESIALIADNLGEAFQKKSTGSTCAYCIDSAYYYFKTALHWYSEMNSPGNIEYAKMNLGSILISKKEYQTAEKYLMESYTYFNSIQDIKYSYNSSRLLSILYEKMGDFKKAYQYNIISLQSKDSLDHKSRADSISRMFAIYETEKRDRAILLLNANAKLDKEKIGRQHLLIWFAIICTALVIILFIVILNRFRIKQKLKEVKVRNQLAADLHDELGSSLSSILLLSKMASNKNNIDQNTLLGKISGNTKEVIEKMGDIVWMMNPKYDEGENLREKLEQYVSRLKELSASTIHLDIDASIDAVKFTMEIRKTILLIIKEAINNSLKYAAAKNLFIHLKIINKNISLIIQDDGIGFNINTIETGNGLGTMALRAKNIQGRFDLHSAEEQGTIIKIIIPIPHFR